MIATTVHYVHTCCIQWASAKIQILPSSQIEEISDCTKRQDMTLYIKFNVTLLL